MPGYIVDERAIREQALALTCQQMGWTPELGRRVFKAFADALREIRARQEKSRLLARAERRKWT
jgi:hypothetical protein